MEEKKTITGNVVTWPTRRRLEKSLFFDDISGSKEVFAANSKRMFSVSEDICLENHLIHPFC